MSRIRKRKRNNATASTAGLRVEPVSRAVVPHVIGRISCFLNGNSGSASFARAIVQDERLKIAARTDARSLTAIITYEGYRLLENAGDQWEQGQTRVVERFGRRKWAAFVAEIDRFRKRVNVSEQENL